MALSTISTVQEALDATYAHARKTVYIGGVLTPAEVYDCHFDRGRTSSANIVIPMPAGSHVRANAEVRIQDGLNNFVGSRFWGRIPSWEKSISRQGNELQVRAMGWSSLLAYRDRFDQVFQGPIKLSTIFDSVCARRGVPSYRADTVLTADGLSEVELGGNTFIDEGTITIPSTSSPLSWMSDIAEMFGYFIFDDDLGTVRLSRISGQPNEEPIVQFRERINIYDFRLVYDTADIVNHWEVQGPTYEDDIGRSQPIRAIPEYVVSDDDIPVNGGVNYNEFRSSYLVTQQLAEAVRNRLEIDESAPTQTVRWSAKAVPGLSVGDVVNFWSPTLGVDTDLWITSIDPSYDYSGDGLLATYEGWSGGGEPLPAGVDRVVIELQDVPVHLGDENVPWYAHPSPQGKEMYWDFDIPKRATAVNVVFKTHGSNSQYIGGKNEDLTVSRFELFKTPVLNPEEDEPHSQGSLPILDENYAQRYNYATDESKWSPGAIALKGFDEEAISVRLYLKSGENKKATAGPWDDFEIKDMYVEIYGTVEPVVVPDEVAP